MQQPVMQQRVLDLLARRRDGLTPDQAAEIMGEKASNIRPRFSELVKKGLIIKTGERRKNKCSRFDATVHVLLDGAA